MSDRGISVAWYDLAEAGRQDYLDWLHGTYIPKLLESPGVLWAAHYRTDERERPLPSLRHTDDASVPTGWRYILILGAHDAHAFSALTPFNRSDEAEDSRMLALRLGERRAVYAEEARVDGPHAKEREGPYLLAPCIQIGSFNSGGCDEEDELLAWYADFRLPSMTRMPSAIGMRKLVSVSGWAKHGVIYEFTSLEGRAQNFRAHEHKDPKQTAWSDAVVRKLLHAPGSPNVAERIYPPIRGARA